MLTSVAPTVATVCLHVLPAAFISAIVSGPLIVLLVGAFTDSFIVTQWEVEEAVETVLVEACVLFQLQIFIIIKKSNKVV